MSDDLTETPFRTVAPDFRRRVTLPLGTLAGLALAAVAAVVASWASVQSSDSRAALVRELTGTQEIVAQAQAVQSTLKDAETGQRGYLLAGDESYLEPYLEARARQAAELQRLRTLVAGDPRQLERVEQLQRLAADKYAELEETIALRRGGNAAQALALVRSERGKVIMDRLRAVARDVERDERQRFETRREEWESQARVHGAFAWGGAGVLLALIFAAGLVASREHRDRERVAWVRTGEGLLGSRLAGTQRLEALGQRVLVFLAEYLGAPVGAAYVAHADGRYHRIAGHALDPSLGAEPVRPGESLVGEAARRGRAVRVQDVPEGYLPIASGTGRGAPRELLIAPAIVDGEVQGVVEVGLLREVDDADRELLDRVAAALAVALRSARERDRREELLEETQRQAEELQAQQEELRVSNEELEEQGRALRESQGRLENQQAELEQANVQLEEQTQRLERQKRELLGVQQALTENARTLERANRYKSEFLANMSHELRTPLNSSLILARLLADNAGGNLDEDQVRYARTIHAANTDLLTLINDILDLSKIEAGQVRMQPEPLDLEAVLAPLQATFEPVAAERRVGWRIVRGPGVPATLASDPQRLAQVLRNLLSNAFKFTERGEVLLEVRGGREGRIEFAVTDTGVGIPEKQHQVIFEAFRQADGTTSRQYGGTGLGLSISRELARLLGGSIRLRSAPGEGSTFTLELPVTLEAAPDEEAESGVRTPLAPAPPPAMAQPAASPPAPAGPHVDDDRESPSRGGRLILVVEDDQRFAQVLRDLAHELGFDCVHCSRAADAMELVKRHSPSGVLLDVQLPDGSGLALLERLKRDPATRHVPVHMVSVEDHARTALGMGAIGYAVKPVAREELERAIGRLEARLRKRVSRVLVVEDDAALRENIRLLLRGEAVEITGVGTVAEALREVEGGGYDCLVTDLALPDATGYELLERLAASGRHPLLPVIVYTGRALSREEETRLARYAKSIIIKGARSPERLLDEVTLFLHQVESTLPAEQQGLLRRARERDAAFEERRILLAEDDVRNIFALSRVLEPLGATVEIARNGQEAVDRVARGGIDLVLMDIMMPVKDGLEAMREIRARPASAKLPMIAITAKAMADDRRQCLAAGANDYIPKPIDVEKLVSLCRVWLSR